MNKLEQAAREVIRQHSMECLSDKAVDALREALAEQAEQEPVGEVFQEEYGLDVALKLPLPPAGTKLYAAPVRTKDLTDDEIDAIDCSYEPNKYDMRDFARAVIAADREKNK